MSSLSPVALGVLAAFRRNRKGFMIWQPGKQSVSYSGVTVNIHDGYRELIAAGILEAKTNGVMNDHTVRLTEEGAKMYQYRRRIAGEEWQDCTEADARNLLSQGYFDPDIPLDYLESGATVVTSVHEIRINPKLLIVQRSEPTPEEDGEIIFA